MKPPKTAEAMYAVLYKALVTRLYGDVTTAARRKRLTEHDIALIERNALGYLREAHGFAEEFPDFDAREVAAMVLKEGQDFVTVTKAARINQIAKEN